MNQSSPPPLPPPPALPLSQQQPEEGESAQHKQERDRVGKLCQTQCKKFACAIQQCLERQQYQEKRCWKEIAYWDVCCDKIKAREGWIGEPLPQGEGRHY